MRYRSRLIEWESLVLRRHSTGVLQTTMQNIKQLEEKVRDSLLAVSAVKLDATDIVQIKTSVANVESKQKELFFGCVKIAKATT